MASGQSNELSNTCGSFGTAMADVLQKQMLNNAENTSQSAISDARGSISDIDNMIVPLIIDNPNDASPTCEPAVVQTATSVIQALDTFENGLSAVCVENSTSHGNTLGECVSCDQDNSQPRSSTLISKLQTQSSNTEPMQSLTDRHIMISYHHDSSFDICQRIRDRLQERGYRIWMDINNLHGSIHQGMAEAVEKSSIVLFCINHHYYHSEFCQKEALYTDKIRVNFIPCLLEAEYQPQGWLGIIIRDQLYIDFSAPDNFDRAFEELIAEIQAIDQRSPNPSIQHVYSPSMTSVTSDINVNNHFQYDALRMVVREFRESINRSNHDAQPMNEEEFTHFVDYIRRRVSIDTTNTTTTNSQEILQEILHHTQNQTEFLRRITETLSSITETRTIIKLSLAVALLWTFNKFLNRQ